MEGLIFLHNTFHHIDWLNWVARIITHLGDVAIVWLAIAFVLFWNKKTRKCSIVLICSIGAGYLFNNLALKNIFHLNVKGGNFAKSSKKKTPLSWSLKIYKIYE